MQKHKSTAMGHPQARRWVVRGSVQGVGFRAFVQQQATALGLSGWARNCDDGSVEVYAVGLREQLQTLAASLHAGPRLAQVRSVEEKEAPIERLASFRVVH